MTSNVIFRALEPEDAEVIYTWQNDIDMMRNAVGIERYWTRQECRDWVASKSKKDPYNYWFAICLNDESKRMIGYFGINSIHYINRTANCDAVVIGDKECRDGISWIETYRYMYYYVFEVLRLNRLGGRFMDSHPQTSLIHDLFFTTFEGRLKQYYFKNNRYYDCIVSAIFAEDYFAHKEKGDYELPAIIKRLRAILKSRKETKE